MARKPRTTITSKVLSDAEEQHQLGQNRPHFTLDPEQQGWDDELDDAVTDEEVEAIMRGR